MPICRLLAVLAMSFLPFAAQAQVFEDLSSMPTGRIEFNSVTPKTRFELVHRTYDKTPVKIWGDLLLPSSGKAPYPAMVLSHGSAGIQQKDRDRWARFLNRMGVAVFLVDSFKPRGIGRTDEDQGQLDQSVNDIDALFALKLLATDPRIDPRRIGSMGFSRGGIVALETAVQQFRRGVIDNDVQFAAHIAFYPGCSLRYWRTPSPLTGAPIMLALAEKDDYTLARPCLDFARVMKEAGQDVEVHVYADAYHDFDNTVDYVKRNPNVQTSKHCPDREIDPATWNYRLLATDETFSDYKAFAARVGNCSTRGDVTTRNNREAARLAEQDVKAFLTRVFGLPAS